MTKTVVSTSALLLSLTLLTTAASASEFYRGGIKKQVILETPTYGGQVNQNNGPAFSAGTAYAANDKGVIGASFVLRPKVEPVVQNVYPGTPAYHAGLLPGDRIVMIDNQPAKGWSMEEVDYAIPDKPGETVTFLIDRYGKMTMKAVVVQSLNAISSAELRNAMGQR